GRAPMSHAPQFPVVTIPHLAETVPPAVQRVRLRHPTAQPVGDVEASVRQALDRSRRLATLEPGSMVALAVGSRGIAEIPRVARVAVAWLKGRKLSPFIVPAMGSHGGGTAEGQAGVLAKLGITEESVGAPVRATM